MINVSSIFIFDPKFATFGVELYPKSRIFFNENSVLENKISNELQINTKFRKIVQSI